LGKDVCMFDLVVWEAAFLKMVGRLFGARVVCAGVQGSRARGEAHEDSDVDAVLILDELSAQDLADYRAGLQTLPYAELACGFVSGKRELAAWEPSELISFYFDTVPLSGDLEFIRPALTREAAERAVLSGACGVYHACCHACLFGGAAELRPLQKAVFFILRVKRFAETGDFVIRETDLMMLLDGEDRNVYSLLVQPGGQPSGKPFPTELAGALLRWSGRLIMQYGGG